MDRYTRLAPSGTVDTDAASRVVRYVFSDESVGRDGHIVRADAWRTQNFEQNPVFLWAHDDDQPPIGRVFGLVKQRELRGGVKYAETDFADTIYQLVRGGFLSAVSTSWMPITYDRMPSGSGLIFTDVDLLEISQCPVPALPTALATARSRVNTRPLYEWASRALDTGRFGTLDRPLVEAVCRAARPASTSTYEQRLARARALQRGSDMTSEHQTRYERYRLLTRDYAFTAEQVAYDLGISTETLRRSVAIALASGDTVQRAASVLPFQARRFSETDKSKLRGISGHLERALKHHRTLSGDHDTMGDHVRGAQEAHRRLTSTLKDLGEKDRAARTTSTLAALGYDHHRITRALSELGECLDVIAQTHGSADDAAQSARQAARQAHSGIEGILGTGGED